MHVFRKAIKMECLKKAYSHPLFRKSLKTEKSEYGLLKLYSSQKDLPVSRSLILINQEDINYIKKSHFRWYWL